MKRLVGMLLAVIMIFSSVLCFADTDIAIRLNGKGIKTDVAPIIENDRTLVPFRAIFEALGVPVMWQAEKMRAYTTKVGATVVLTANSNKMLVNGVVVILDIAPFILDGRMMIPAREVCEALGCEVDWDDTSRTVIIKTGGYVEETYLKSPGYEYGYIVKEVFDLINAERESHGVAALMYDTGVHEVAYNHSIDMSQKSYVDHTTPDGFTLRERLDNDGVPYSITTENLASGFTTADSVVNAWKNSKTHYERILNPKYKRVGIGYCEGGEDGAYWSLILAG